jgi:hypothetical protein
MIDKDLIIQLQQEHLGAQAKLIAMQNSQLGNKHNLIGELRTMIKLPEAHIATLQNNQQKDSTNSSKLPSSDIGKPQRNDHTRTHYKASKNHSLIFPRKKGNTPMSCIAPVPRLMDSL